MITGFVCGGGGEGGGVWGCGGVYLPNILDSLNYYIK